MDKTATRRLCQAVGVCCSTVLLTDASKAAAFLLGIRDQLVDGRSAEQPRLLFSLHQIGQDSNMLGDTKTIIPALKGLPKHC
jgi:hypothetical protein